MEPVIWILLYSILYVKGVQKLKQFQWMFVWIKSKWIWNVVWNLNYEKGKDSLVTKQQKNVNFF